MVSCTVGSETRALGQVKNFLDATVHTLFPEHELTWERFEGDLDVPELVKNSGDGKEEAEEKDDNNEKTNEANGKEEPDAEPSSKKDKRFQGVDSACSGLLFFRFRVNVKPTDFMSKLIEQKDLIDANKIKYCSRFVPIDYICPATTDRMTKCFERLREQELDPIKTDTKVAIVTEIRNNISLKKPDIIQLIAPMIPKEHFTVDLTKPDIVIFCTVFKSVCGMSVLRDYYPRKKYNLIALLEDK
ncbi:hypothetical protein BDB00DRAFT_883363 [Zychaea mexicana]|uniref:uncharacterized protein n=1 Tax=Zychaea mexicana TaxID=64656 RepID=UPI0022FECF7F|nr:uncharacterized protein BDB00DRAFT_883363 [Zychaea mexicana]KAI9492697.1 hypothetical protein BDB00DRAFT_883363 [Zychaea mexicana]